MFCTEYSVLRTRLMQSPYVEQGNKKTLCAFDNVKSTVELKLPFRITNNLCSSRFLYVCRTREQRSAPEGEQKIGERWRGGEREGGGGGEKRNRLQSIPNILPNSVRPRTESNSSILLVSSPSIKK